MRPIENKDELMSEIKRLLNIGYSQQKVADTLRIGQNTVSRWLLEEKKELEKPEAGIKKKCAGCYQVVTMKFWGNYGFGDKYACPKCKMVQSQETKKNPVTIRF